MPGALTLDGSIISLGGDALTLDYEPPDFGYPDPSEVLEGVVYGQGLVGTLVLPSVANVRYGVQFGGNGTEYTGQLYAPTSDNSWTDTMLNLWMFEWSKFGTTAQFNSHTLRCIKDPVRSQFNMSTNAYDGQGVTILDILRTDAIACGLYALVQVDPARKRPIVTISEKRYTINKLENDDDEQPSIRVSAVLEQ